jgi:hypothetical protein
MHCHFSSACAIKDKDGARKGYRKENDGGAGVV